MDLQGSSAGGAQNRTAIECRGDRELVVTRTFSAPASTVYRAWSQPELFRRWWMPKSVSGVSLVSCDMDVRTGGKYRLEFSTDGADTMAFYGKYLEVLPTSVSSGPTMKAKKAPYLPARPSCADATSAPDLAVERRERPQKRQTNRPHIASPDGKHANG